MARHRHLILEEGTQSAWGFETLERHVDEIVVASVPESRGHKSDSRGAYDRKVDDLATAEQNPGVARNKRDIAHFEAIGQALAAAKEADILDATTSSPAERVRAGFLLGDVPRSVAIDAAIEAEALGQIGLANRRPLRSR